MTTNHILQRNTAEKGTEKENTKIIEELVENKEIAQYPELETKEETEAETTETVRLALLNEINAIEEWDAVNIKAAINKKPIIVFLSILTQ